MNLEPIHEQLRQVGFRNAFHGYNFTEFIPDFVGSEQAVERIMVTPQWNNARFLFLTPDDIAEIRYQALLQGKSYVISTHGIQDGLRIMQPHLIKPRNFLYAATLEGMERVGKKITLAELQEAKRKIDLLITGSLVVSSVNFVRYGKGHGYFDMEAALLWDADLLAEDVQCFAIVHDCQVLDESLPASDWDTRVDAIFTPNQTYWALKGQKFKPTTIHWEALPERHRQSTLFQEGKEIKEKAGK